MANDIKRQLDRIEKNQQNILKKVGWLTEVSEILLQKVTGDPDILAKIESQKGAGKPVPGKRKRKTKKQRVEDVRQQYYQLGKENNNRIL
jgi:hypothetical protein